MPFRSFALLVLITAAGCGGAQRSAPAGEPIAVVIPAAPDAGAKAPVAEPVAVASAEPVASAPPPEEREPSRRDRPRSTGGGPFDRAAAAEALSEIDPSMCATPGGPRGRGHVQITFHPSGNVQSVRVDQPFFGTSSGACVVSLYSSITIPWFSGSPVTVGKSFVVP